ncbi:MAG: hypothetical protein JNM89_00780 [Hyphomicrobiaceae bacterium]|nr:hypothetical protein [Hyphomicrobiaceae bacterium]
MHRREFLKSTSIAALAAGTLPAAAATASGDLAAPAPRMLRLATPWADAVAGPGDHAQRLAARIAAATSGRWNVEVAVAQNAPGSVIGGDAELCLAPERANAARHRAFAWFSSLPSRIGLDADAHAAWIATGGGQELWDELGADHNLKGLLAGWTGAAPALWSRVPFATPSDLAGKRIAVEGLASDIVAGLGALPVTVAPDEIADALAAGEIDSAVAPDASLWTRRRLLSAAPYAYHSNLDRGGGAITLATRRSFWDALTEGDRILLSALSAEAFAASFAEAAAEAAMAAALPSDLLAPIAPLPAAIDEVIERIAMSVVAEAAGADAISRRINHSYMSFRSRTRQREGDLVG